jgi:hypothetical protein
VGWAKPAAQLTGRLQSLGLTDSAISSLLPLLGAEAGLSQLTSLLRVVTRRRGEAAERVKAALSQLKALVVNPGVILFRIEKRLFFFWSLRIRPGS